jgi:hypothetical protein
MELESSSLYNEVQLITAQTSKPVSNYWTAEIHTGDVTTQLMKIITIHTFRDYEKNIGDELMMEAVVPLGVYAKIIFPSRAVLEITLYKTPVAEVGANIQDDQSVESERFKAVLVLDGLPNVEGSEIGQLTQQQLDLKDIINIHFQLLNKSLDKLRTLTVGGIFRNTRTDSVIRAMIGKETKELKINSSPVVDLVDVNEGSNKTVKDHVVIPQGTKLTNLPTYIQESCGGVYNAGLGSYFQNKTWYVYPLYDTTKINKALRTITLIKVPKRRFTGIERTYREAGTSLFVLGTSDTRFKDDGSVNFMNSGNGVMLADAGQFMGNLVATAANKAILKRTKLNSEFVNKLKEDGINNIQLSVEKISSNPFNAFSRLAGKEGGIFDFVWENSNPSLIFPGMMAKVLYIDGADLQELNGVILCSDSLVELEGTGFTGSKHRSTTRLSVFVNKAVK